MNKPEYYVDKERCIRCGNCGFICSGQVVFFDEDGYPYIDEQRQEYCFTCGQCVSVCPTDALRHSNINPAKCQKIDDRISVTKEQVEHLIKTRRSVRNFTDEPISREEIEQLLEVVRFAPTGGNYQGVRWLALDDPQVIGNVRKHAENYLLDFVKQPGNEWLLLPAEAGRENSDWLFWNAPVILVITADNPTDLAIAGAYLDLYAQSAGYGCCWCGYLNFAMEGGDPELMKPFQDAGLKECFYPMIMGVPDKRIKYYKIPQRNEADVRFL